MKMSIESKDVLGASTLTPTFTERTITGTARVQNNRTDDVGKRFAGRADQRTARAPGAGRASYGRPLVFIADS